MCKPTIRERISYWFDHYMSKGTAALIALLLGATLLVALAVALLSTLLTPDHAGPLADSLWGSFMRILDASNVSADWETRNTVYIALMILAALCGLFITSILIGIINTAFQSRLESLRRGNSRVLEKNHTLILGYDEHLSTVLTELVAANENERRPAVVLLCERDKTELEDELHSQIADFKNTRLICRNGDPTCFQALRNVSIAAAARVVVLGGSDFEIIKGILAARTMLDAGGAPLSATIAAVIIDPQNLDAARIAGGARVEVLNFDRLISRIFAQTSRQAGLSQVYQEMFDFGGDEIYMEKAPSLAGVRFADAPRYFRHASLMGLIRDGHLLLSPPGDTLLAAQDELVLLARDNGVAVPAAAPAPVDTARFRAAAADMCPPRRMLILGVNRLTHDIVREISVFAAPGTVLTVASALLSQGGTDKGNLRVNHSPCDIYDRAALEALLKETEPECIIVLSEACECDADARTLAILLQLSHYYRNAPGSVVVVSEMRQKKNQALAACARVNDFVIGSNLAALILTQVSQNRLLNQLFDELLTEDGCEIRIIPARQCVETGVPVSLHTVAAAAAEATYLLLGLRLREADGGYTVRMNPDREEVRVFEREDCLIVLAQW
jgi:Trk K+ transport system NAD-binding subunit